MNRANSSEEESVTNSVHERAIEAVVEGLIARRGYESVIYELVTTVYNLSQTSMADPKNEVKKRDFSIWARIVRFAIQQHEGDSGFANSIIDEDHRLAHLMGITLD